MLQEDSKSKLRLKEFMGRRRLNRGTVVHVSYKRIVAQVTHKFSSLMYPAAHKSCVFPLLRIIAKKVCLHVSSSSLQEVYATEMQLVSFGGSLRYSRTDNFQ